MKPSLFNTRQLTLFPEVQESSSRYRYLLSRDFTSGNKRVVVFIMLNPSTATQTEDDPTIRRCIGFAKRWGYCRLEVVNLFAIRSTDPGELKLKDNPVGVENNRYILEAVCKSDQVIAAWGTHGKWLDRDKEVCNLIKDYTEIMCFDTNKDGTPKHPLYVRLDQKLIPYQGRS